VVVVRGLQAAQSGERGEGGIDDALHGAPEDDHVAVLAGQDG
jgi:hypothetical protein